MIILQSFAVLYLDGAERAILMRGLCPVVISMKTRSRRRDAIYKLNPKPNHIRTTFFRLFLPIRRMPAQFRISSSESEKSTRMENVFQSNPLERCVSRM